MRSSAFLACFIAIATAVVLADGSGWWEKKKKKKKSKSARSDGEKERLWPAPLGWHGSLLL